LAGPQKGGPGGELKEEGRKKRKKKREVPFHFSFLGTERKSHRTAKGGRRERGKEGLSF